MTELMINTSTPFGAEVAAMVQTYFLLDQQITRVSAAYADAASGFAGTAGTEYETGTNIGVVPSSTPGAQGLVAAFAEGTVTTAWATFKAAADAAMKQLDQGA